MGLFKRPSWSSYDAPPPEAPNPDPRNYRITRHEQLGDALVLEVVYPDCTNYEGRKIMVFQNTRLSFLKKQGSIDPHFSNNPSMHSPIARFEPTELGWHLARQTARALNPK